MIHLPSKAGNHFGARSIQNPDISTKKMITDQLNQLIRLIQSIKSLGRVHKIAFLAIALSIAISACGTDPNPKPSTTSAPTISISGAGASFPAPLYMRWFAEYNKQNPQIEISYQSVGSGAGIKQYLGKTVDFGATDQPLTEKEKAKYQGKPVQIPMTAGAMVLAYNLTGVNNLKLSRDAYCGIVLGEIKTWNDPKITKDNASVNLPNSPIAFVHRADSSGTTFIFTNHLQSACPNWQLGAGKSVNWQVGSGSKGNEGITAQVMQTVGAIGYTEYSYAKENNLTTATLQNKAGKFIAPSPIAANKAIASATVPEDLALLIPDPEDTEAYPIVGLTWLLVYEQYDQPAKAEAIKGMVKWALQDGKKYAEELGYLPLPEKISTKVITMVDQIK
jgi:phosphate transport system substrate-binding protein